MKCPLKFNKLYLIFSTVISQNRYSMNQVIIFKQDLQIVNNQKARKKKLKLKKILHKSISFKQLMLQKKQYYLISSPKNQSKKISSNINNKSNKKPNNLNQYINNLYYQICLSNKILNSIKNLSNKYLE